jgi:acyl dehydratase
MAELPAVGETASLSKVLRAEDVESFAAVTGDANPVHLDADYAARTRFGQRIGHGMWAGSLISAVLGTRLPGPGTIYLSQELRFLAPVHIGDTVTATVRVEGIRDDKPIVTLATTCANGSGEPVVTGRAVVLVDPVTDGDDG